MDAHRVIADWGVRSALVSGLILAGCQNHSPTSAPLSRATGTPPAAAPDPPVPVATPPAPAAEPAPRTADLLAEKAATYAKSVEPMLQKRAAAVEAPPVAQSIDPDAMRLDPAIAHSRAATTADSPQQIASVAPVVPAAAPPKANSVAVSLVSTAVTPPHDAATALTVSAVPARGTDDSIARRLGQRVHDDPQDLSAQLDYQLLQMLSGEPVPQLTALAPLAAEDRELVSAVTDGISNFRDGIRNDSNMLLSRKVRPILEMADRLRSQAELSIPTIALCKRVDGFGVYEPIEGERFIAGQEQPVIIYCEVENFASQLSDQKKWETKLKQQVVLYTEQNGLEVWREKQTKPVVDLSRNRRHDFFIVQMIRLPATLTIGRYLLKVSVEDLQVNRIAENTVAIQIVAQ